MRGRHAVVLGLLAASLTLAADHHEFRAEVPRVDLAARQALLALAAAVPSFDRLGDGQRLYQANCASCHGGSEGGTADYYPPRHNATGHTWQHTDCDLEQIVRDGPAPGLTRDSSTGGFAASRSSQMPPFRDRLTDAQIRDVLAFIKTMWTEEQRVAQAATTARGCVAVR